MRAARPKRRASVREQVQRLPRYEHDGRVDGRCVVQRPRHHEARLQDSDSRICRSLDATEVASSQEPGHVEHHAGQDVPGDPPEKAELHLVERGL